MSIDSIKDRIEKAELKQKDIARKIRGLEVRKTNIDYTLDKLNRQLLAAKRS